jgi:GxxExxY protein
MPELKYVDESYQIRGAIYAVYEAMGCGFLEAVYQECLEREFTQRGIPFAAQPDLILHYKGERLIQTYRPDFICYNLIIVELKAAHALIDQHRAQVHNYLKATKLQLGMLVNFGHYPLAQIERIVR